MAHAFRRRPDGTLACRLDGEEKAIIAQVAQETADLIRGDLGIEADGGALRRAAESEDPLRRLEAEFAGREARTPPTPRCGATSPPRARIPSSPPSTGALASATSPTASSPTCAAS